MTRLNGWKFGTAALMAMAMTTGAIAPMFAPTPASAQLLRGGQNDPYNNGSYNNGQYNNGQYNRSISIPTGVRLPVTYEKDRVVVTPDETTSLTVKVARNIIDRNGNILIPEGSEIKGQVEPANRNSQKGARFVGQELIFPNGTRYSIDATSQTVTRTETIKKGANTGKILTDAAIGAGAASVIAIVTGNHKIEPIEPILGAGAGAAASVFLRRKEAKVVVIEPRKGDLDVTLRSNLQLSSRY